MKQHFVPEAYLKNFTKKNRKFFKWRTRLKKRPIPTEIFPSGVCYERGFYDVNKSSFFSNLDVSENFLENNGFLYENRLRKIISNLVDNKISFLVQDAFDFILIMIDLKMRNQYARNFFYNRDNIVAQLDNILSEDNDIFQEFVIKGKLPFNRFKAIADSAREAWVKDEFIAQEMHNRSILDNKLNPSPQRRFVYERLLKSKWLLLSGVMNNQFITSDNPGFCYDLNNRIYNTRFVGEGGFVFPLTPYYTLVVVLNHEYENINLDGYKNITRRVAETEWIKYSNIGTWMLSDKEVYSSYSESITKTWYAMNPTGIII